MYLYPALVPEDQTVSLRLLDTVVEAQEISKAGTDLLLRRALSKELHEISKQSQGVDHFKPLITLFATPERLREAAVRHLFDRESTSPLLERDFHKASDLHVSGSRILYPLCFRLSGPVCS